MQAAALLSMPAFEASCIDRFVGGDWDAFLPLFRSWGAPDPVVIPDPAPSMLADDRHRRILEQWIAQSCPHGMPDRTFVRPEALRYILGYLMVLDVERGDGVGGDGIGGDSNFRYRIYGSEIAKRFIVDMTGRLCTDIPVPQSALFFLAVYRASLKSRRPIFTSHAPPQDIDVSRWDRLILPIAEAGSGEIVQFVVANLPGAWRGKQPVPVSGR